LVFRAAVELVVLLELVDVAEVEEAVLDAAGVALVDAAGAATAHNAEADSARTAASEATSIVVRLVICSAAPVA
jgi:hypothetical protein